MEILEFGPKEIFVNQPFNPQPNGTSAIWIRASEISENAKIQANGLMLYSSVFPAERIVSATVPDWFYQFPGTIEFKVIDETLNDESDKYSIPVIGDPTGTISPPTVESYLKLQDELHRLKHKFPVQFSGWGMATAHAPAWTSDFNSSVFHKTHVEVKDKFELSPLTTWTREMLEELKWRHWNVCVSARLASHASANATFVECGVGDGITAMFALRELEALQKNKKDFKYEMHLYDSWGPMKEGHLLETEKHRTGNYKELSLELTKRNLADFNNECHYHVGYIPDTLPKSVPEDAYIVWLHLDLNAALPTTAALEFFYPKMPAGSIVLIDDYGWDECRDTREVLDKFFKSQSGELLALPTGQAFYFKF